MKLLCSLVLFFSLGATTLCCQNTKKRANRNRDPQANGLVKKDKSKSLWQGKKTFLSANFIQSRNINGLTNSDNLRRTSSYTAPILYGIKLGSNWSAETGPFIGLNRHSYQRPGLLKEVAPMPSVTELTYGFMVGISRKLSDRLAIQFRYRKDFSDSIHAWQPLEFGWRLSF